MLAVSGLAELLLQRVVYRIGVHIPRDGTFLTLYETATWTGDFAFRLTAVLAAVTAGLMVFLGLRHLAAGPAVAAFLATLLAADLLAWPAGLDAAPVVAGLTLTLGVAWLVGRAFAAGYPATLKVGIAAAGLAVGLAQYRPLSEGLGLPAGPVGPLQATMEAAVLVAAALFALAALSLPGRRFALGAAALVAVVAAAVYFRQPSTTAIVSLWATGITLSLPGPLYLAAIGALAFAATSWLRSAEHRHLGLALVLLTVAGVHPQALHYNLISFMGLALLALGPAFAMRAEPAPSAIVEGT
jgi:hypothetical protein